MLALRRFSPQLEKEEKLVNIDHQAGFKFPGWALRMTEAV